MTFIPAAGVSSALSTHVREVPKLCNDITLLKVMYV